jgi:hypothetical protein
MESTEETDDDQVAFNIDPETMMDILRVAASRERTVVEFRTRDGPDGRMLDTVLDITDHVESLEDD